MNKVMNIIKKLWNDGGVRRMLLTFAATELVCSGLMVGVFALLGKYTPQVAVGAIVGSVLAVANFAVLSIGVEKSVEAFDREGNPAGAKLAVQLSSSVASSQPVISTIALLPRIVTCFSLKASCSLGIS